jgi:hypothetical protein
MGTSGLSVASQALRATGVAAIKAQPPAVTGMPDVIAELSELPGDLGDMLVSERARERSR